jgi:hypothetical protein
VRIRRVASSDFASGPGVEGAGEAETLRGVELDMTWICCKVLERSGREGPGTSATSDPRDACDEAMASGGASFS